MPTIPTDCPRQGLFYNAAVGFSYVFFLWLINLFGSVFMMAPALPLLLVAPALFRHWTDFCFYWGIFFSAFVLDVVWGVRIVVTGDAFRPERLISLVNHRTNFDWLYYWSFLAQYGGLSKIKIVLKGALKKAYGFSWVGQFSAFAYITRKFETDKPILHRLLTLYCTIPEYPYHFLLFPEGTDLNPRSKASSDRWAEKNGLPLWDYVLHPRTTGLNYCLEVVRARSGIDAIYDVTVGYLDGPVVSKLGIIKGQPPREVHIHIRRYPIAQVPTEAADIEKWCEQMWSEKEPMLERFYEDKQFPGPQQRPNPYHTALCLLAALYWAVFIPGCIYGVYACRAVRLWFFVCSALCAYFTHTSGLESLELKAWNIRGPPKPKD
jgi:lysocardiolipin and lysophospholipid acyltransferase